MFSIEIVKKNKSQKLYQWDVNRYIEFTSPAGIIIEEVEFAHENDKEAISMKIIEENGVFTSKIPNKLMQSSHPIRVWLRVEEQTVFGDVLVVLPKAKTPDYVLPDDADGVLRYRTLEERVTKLENDSDIFLIKLFDRKVDKTYDEIVQAYDDGKNIVLRDTVNSKDYYLTSIELEIETINFAQQEGVNHNCIFLTKTNNHIVSFSYKMAKQVDLDKLSKNKGDVVGRIGKTIDDIIVEIEPNKLYVFPEMPSLTYTLIPEDDTKAEEYHFIFVSGGTPTEVTHPEGVKIGDFKVEANKVYEVSILEGLLLSQSWAVE